MNILKDGPSSSLFTNFLTSDTEQRIILNTGLNESSGMSDTSVKILERESVSLHKEQRTAPTCIVARKAREKVVYNSKLQALVYDSLPPATAVTDKRSGLKKLSSNGFLFLGAQMAAGL